ncbi:Hippocampus abundant transcript 1 protein [Sparganum proliferum]
MSDMFGRKPFLFLTVTFTCSPIPLIKLSHWWYFTMISISGIFSVTFSVVLAFVSDVTTVEDRSWAYGLVSATFAASLIISPALGAFLEKAYSENLVISLATAIALLDILFIMICVPESLGVRSSGHLSTGPGTTAGPGSSGASGSPTPLPSTPPKRITWDKVDPFGGFRRMSNDRLTLIVCMTTFLSYLPETGEYSCFFVYLRLVMGFSEESVALFIAMCGLVSCLAQTCGLGILIGTMGAKRAIIVGLTFEVCQLAMFGFSSSAWILWTAGGVAGLGTITYPALSAFLSNHANSDQQGLTQGLLTGIRGLCGGLGPALYGFIFFIFQVDLNVRPSNQSILGGLPPPQPQINKDLAPSFQQRLKFLHESLLPGPPFAFGAILALTAIITAIFLPEDSRVPTSGPSLDGWDAEDRALIASALEDTEDGDDKGIQGTENATFVGFYDRRRRAGDKLDLLPHRHLKRSSSPKSMAEGKEHSFLHGIDAHLPLILRTRARSRLGFMAAANPLRRIFSAGGGPHLSRPSPRDCQIREDLRPAAVEEARQSLNPWREATEAADLANYRHHRMQHLFDPQEEARRREAEVASVRAARLAEGQVGRRSVGACSAPRAGFQHNELCFEGRGTVGMSPAALNVPVLLSSNESRRAGDKLDLLPHRHLKRSSSPKSMAEGKEHSFLHGIDAHPPLILRTRARSRLGFMAAANPLRRIFSAGGGPHLSRPSPRDCQIREDLRPAAVEERQSLNPWREATEAADLANYRHHRMQHLFDPHEEARRREAEVTSVRAARLAEGQVGRRSVGACSAPRAGFQHNELCFEGRGTVGMSPAALNVPVLLSSNESRHLLLKPDFTESPNFRTPSVSLMARPLVQPTPPGRFVMASQSLPPCILLLGCAALRMGPYRQTFSTPPPPPEGYLSPLSTPPGPSCRRTGPRTYFCLTTHPNHASP